MDKVISRILLISHQKNLKKNFCHFSTFQHLKLLNLHALKSPHSTLTLSMTKLANKPSYKLCLIILTIKSVICSTGFNFYSIAAQFFSFLLPLNSREEQSVLASRPNQLVVSHYQFSLTRDFSGCKAWKGKIERKKLFVLLCIFFAICLVGTGYKAEK